MRIGELAKKTKVSTQTIRFYERAGLLSKPSRRTNGYRDYSPKAVGEIAFVKECQNAGFTLKEIELFGGLDPEGSNVCSEMGSLLRRKAAAVEHKITGLVRARKLLAEMQAHCDGAPGTACPVLESLRGVG